MTTTPSVASGQDTRRGCGYIRVSTDKQECARQEQTIPERHANLPDGLSERAIDLFYDEGISGYDPTKRRPGFDEMLESIRRGERSFLVIDTSSRLTRQGIRHALAIFFDLQDVNCRLFTTQGREYTFDLGGIISLIVDAERDQGYSRDLGHNVKTGRARIAALGGWSGGPAPVGYKTEAHTEKRCRFLVPDEPTASVIRSAFARYSTGDPIHKVSLFLADSLPDWPRTRKRDYDTLRHATRKVLRNRTYLGLIPRRVEDEWLPGLHDAPVDDETFSRCQTRLDSNAREWTGITLVQSFGSQLRCGACGARCEFHRPRKDWTYYRCANPPCRQNKATASYVEASFAIGLAAVAQELDERLDDPAWAILKSNADDLAANETELAKIADQTDFIFDRQLEGTLTRQQATNRLADLKERREALEARLRLLADDGAGMRKALGVLRDQLMLWSECGVKTHGENSWLGSFFYTWALAPVEYRRALVHATTERIELHEDRIVIYFQAGIFIPVPVHSGRRENHFAPGLEGLGFGKPRNLADAYALDPSLRELCEPSGSSSSHASTTCRSEVGAFSQ
jgi:DNA invertase Pin-like site-specific DNA recombinase